MNYKFVLGVFIGILSLFLSTNAEEERFLDNPKYLSHNEVIELFEELKDKYPNLTEYQSIGKSVEGRELLVIRLSSDVSKRSHLKPMFKYVANMHGDETIGRQLLLFLAQYLLHNYNSNTRVKNLLDTIDVYLMPSLNPDGFAAAEEGLCESPPTFKGRNNANNVDLNRDFPDQFDTDNDQNVTRQPETLAVMKWILNNTFVLSGNLHGGAVVASYPYDDSLKGQGDGCCNESKTPDDSLFKKLALTYANSNPEMHVGNSCKPDNFSEGITNGAFWYEVKGGMQDFNYLKGSCMEVTFELSCCKFPMAHELPRYWENNKESLLSFMEAARWGVKGIVTESGGTKVPHAEVEVKGINHSVFTSKRGEYWRLLIPGKYEIRANAPGYHSSPWQEVTIPEGSDEAVIVNIEIHPKDSGN